jgi:DHA1 family bicyclomycin/chloramphenicol resistance-like MFS transporter
VLGLVTVLGPLSMDLYLPALPRLQRDLGASDLQTQLTLAGMTLGMALGQLPVGIWSDRLGRRIPLVISTALHLAATIGCALAPTIELLISCRFVQGVGAAGSAVLVMAIVRDVATGSRLVQLLARVTLVTTTVPLLAPIGGAALTDRVGWRGIFAVLVIISAGILIMAARAVPETRPEGRPLQPLAVRLVAVLRDREFRLGTVVTSMAYAGVYAYVAAAPLLLQHVYGLSPQAFAVVFLANGLGLVLGVRLASLLARGWPPRRVLLMATGVTTISAAAIAPMQWAGAGLAGLLPCLWVFIVGCGACFPCAEGIAFDEQGDQAGTATSVHGFFCFTVAGLATPLPGLWGITGALPVAVTLLACAVIATATAVRMIITRAPVPVAGAGVR